MAGALVGGAFLSAALQVLFDRLATREVVNFIRGNKLDHALLKKLKMKLQIVHVVLDDAERKQFTIPEVRDWTHELKYVFNDAEDVPDDIATEHLRCKIESVGSQVRSAPALDVQSINSRMKEIVDRLEDILQQRDVLGLKDVGEKSTQRWPSTSLVDESQVYGRDEIKEEMVQRLLSGPARSTTDGAIDVTSIVGLGGTGKTTLAQLLYNEPRVRNCFNIKAWVYVSQEFDPIRITKTILEEIDPSPPKTTNLNCLQVRLKEKVDAMKFLIVLDDVWNEDSSDLELLQTPLKFGAKGSKIIVTTRSSNVALALHAVHTHHLGGLSDEDSWSLFRKLAFENGDSREHPQLKEIGRKIVQKCQGLPLAIKAMGSLLHSKIEAREWDDVLISELWNLPKDVVLPALRLSYCYLPLHLKRCFSYCSMFPKDYKFEKEKLILLWMAEGLLDQPKSNKRMEEIGNLYFQELLSMSFFQKSTSNESCFVMHNLINDLARFVSGEFFICSKDDGKICGISEKTLHLSFLANECDVYEKFETMVETKRLRSYLPISKFSLNWLSNRVLHNLVLEMKYLRVLALRDYVIINLSDSIGKLEHLRYLDLSNTLIEKLPESVCNLYNLQTLMLWNCKSLLELPSRMRNLMNLRYLDFRNTGVVEMPSDIYKLKNLQSLLPMFIVGQNGGLRIGELRELSGSLTISNLENVKSERNALEANMKDKKYLDDLYMEWDYRTIDVVSVEQKNTVTLTCLQPHTNLKRLGIYGYSGSSFSNWVGDPSFLNLVDISLRGCYHCSSLPSLGQLPSLKKLSLSKMEGIKRVGSEFYHRDYGNGNASTSSTAFKPSFQFLRILKFEQMPNWEKWLWSGCRCGEFPRLQELYIIDCPLLIGKLPKQLRSLRKLDISECPRLHVASLRAPSVLEVRMVDCGKFRLKGFAGQSSKIILDISEWQELPPGLEELTIRECDSVEWVLEEGILQMGATTLLRLSIQNCGFTRPLDKVDLPTTLKSLTICDCKNNLEFLLHGLLKSHHPFLEHLGIENSGSCNPLSLSVSLSTFPRLIGLVITNVVGLEFLQISILEGDPTSLNNFEISRCLELVHIELPIVQSAKYYVYGCRKLKLLAVAQTPSLASLQCLRLEECPEMLFQKEGFPSDLRELEIASCDQLTPQVDWGLQRRSSLTSFTISGGCQDMESFPNESLSPSSLTSLSIESLSDLKSLDGKGLQHLTSLSTLNISYCPELQSLGEEEGLRYLTSLTTLYIFRCPKLQLEGLQHLTSLTRLDISFCSELQSFGEEEGLLRHLTSLTTLSISCCHKFQSFGEEGLQCLASLKKLFISDCRQLQYLTKQKRLPNSLHLLSIRNCPSLKERCKFVEGQDWKYIAHIPGILIDGELY